MIIIIAITIFVIAFLSFTTQWWWGFLSCLFIIIIAVSTVKRIISNSEIPTYSIVLDTATLFGGVFLLLISNENSIFIVSIIIFLNKHNFLYDISILVLFIYSFSLIFFYGIISLLKLLLRDNTAMQKNNLDVKLFDDSFENKRESFCKLLENDLYMLNRSTQWSDDYFVPLDATFTVENRFKLKKSNCELIPALLKNKNEPVFLVLGEPGSGKSTALRKLAKNLLSEVHKTNKIPLYVNLKEWNVPNINEKNLTVKTFSDFIKSNLKERFSDDFYTADFLDTYFDKLLENGHIFFLLDSFDEIPFLIDEHENSDLIEQVSNLLFQVLAGGGGRGILSSRIFHKPTAAFRARVTLEIKAFDNNKIIECFKQYKNGDFLANKIFTEHRELVSLVKKPFYANLLALFFNRENRIPSKEIDLYHFYFRSQMENIERTQSLLTKNNLTIDDLIIYSNIIAEKLFDNNENYTLYKLIDELKISYEIFDILRKAKILRFDPESKMSVNFSHRRFHEFFMAEQLTSDEVKTLIYSISENTKWHDTLVLYAQICSNEDAFELINYACQIINNYAIECKENKNINFTESYFKAIHSLRFLITSFSGNTNYKAIIEDRINDFIELLIMDNNILNMKFAVEAIPILNAEYLSKVLDKALAEHRWIRDDAVTGCIYLSKLSNDIENKLIRHYSLIDMLTYFKDFYNSKFVLSLNTNFNKVKRFHKMRFVENVFRICYLTSFIVFVQLSKNLVPYNTNNLDILAICIFLLSELLINENIRDIMPLVIYFNYYKNIFILFTISSNIYINIRSLIPLEVFYFPQQYSLYIFKTIFTITWCICGFSFIEFIVDIKVIKRIIKMKKLKNYIFIFVIFIFFLSGALLGYIVYIFLNMIIKQNANILIPIFLSLPILLIIITNLRTLYKDKCIWDSVDKESIIYRKQLSQILTILKTDIYIKHVLHHFENNNIVLVGEWPESNTPILKDKYCSILLAKLEEKWRGF